MRCTLQLSICSDQQCECQCATRSRTAFTMITKQLWYLSNILKTVISTKTIMLLRLLGGQYSKICSNRVVCAVTAIYSVIFSCYVVAHTVDLIVRCMASTSTQTISSIAAYLSSALTSLWYPEYFQVYLSDMADIDILLRGKSELDIPFTRLLFVVAFMTQLGIAAPYIIFGLIIEQGDFDVLNFSFVVCFVLLNITTYLMAVMVFEILWYRVRMFRKHLEKHLPQLCRAQNVQAAAEDICKCMQLYQTILEAFQKTNIPIKTTILTATTTSFCKVLVGVFEVLSSPYLNVKVIRVQEVVFDSLLPLVPAVLAALIQGELNRIKLFIANLILNVNEESVRDALCDCQLYLEHRPFRYSVWRLYTVDLSLVITIINLYVTSLIAMIQLCHFYN